MGFRVWLRQIIDEHHLSSSDIETISVRISQFQFGMCGKKQILSRAEAQMSIAYAMSAWLEFNSVGLKELDLNIWSGNWFYDWFSRISFVVDGDMADDAEPEINVTTVSGVTISKTVYWPLGSPQFPLSEKEIINKYETMAAVCISDIQINALEQMVLTLEEHKDVRNLSNLLALVNDIVISH